MTRSPGTRLLGSKCIKPPGFLVFLLFSFLITLSLTACNVSLPDPETTQDFNQDVIAIIKPGESVGQTFTSRRGALNSIKFWLRPESPSQAFTFELFQIPDGSSAALAARDTAGFTASFKATEGANYIEFPAQLPDPGMSYYIRLSASEGSILVLGRGEDNFPEGAAHINNQPIPADIAFRTTYSYTINAVVSDISQMLSLWLWFLVIGVFLILPGWLLLDLTGLHNISDTGEKVAASIGISLSIIPIMMLWTGLVGLKWGTLSLWIAAALLIITLGWRAIEKRSFFRAPGGRRPSPPTTRAALTILLILFLATLFTRFAMVRDLAAPAWVDSIHHGVITKAILEHGTLPQNYLPYLPEGASEYHIGFHTTLAVFTWMSGLDLHTAMLIYGQVLNALIVFAIYLLTRALTGSKSAGILSALIAGLFTLMPAYYASWGRYTHLAGLLILPVGLWLFSNLQKPRKSASKYGFHLGLTSLIFAGIFLTHYRVAVFLGVLVLVYTMIQLPLSNWHKSIKDFGLLALFSIIWILPWLPSFLNDLIIPKSQEWVGKAAEFSRIPWRYLHPASGDAALVLAGIGLLLGFILRKRFTITLILWTGILYLLANFLVIFPLPGMGFINPLSVEITLFMPIAVAGGFAFGGLEELLQLIRLRFPKTIEQADLPTSKNSDRSDNTHQLPARIKWALRLLLIFIGGLAVVGGSQRLLPKLNPVTFLAREADFPAIAWLDEHLVPRETVLINQASWGYGLTAGSDGGYWISALSDHPTIPPPVIYSLGTAEEIEAINQLAHAVADAAHDPAELWEIMHTHEIRYIYTGARGGTFSPQLLSDSNLFTTRYNQDGVWVFETRPQPQKP